MFKNHPAISTLLITACFLLMPSPNSYALTYNIIHPVNPILANPIQPPSEILPVKLQKFLKAPSNLQLEITENLNGGPNVQTINWIDNSSDEDGFVLERSADDLAFSDVAQVSANTTSVRIAPEPNTLWTYRVRAFAGTERTEPSNSVTAGGMPFIPTDLTVRPGSGSENAVSLHWKTPGNSTPNLHWVIKRASSSSEQYFSSTASNYMDTTVQPDTVYTYSVQSVSPGGRTAFCSPATLTVLSAPSNLSAVLTPGLSGISKLTVSWKDNSSNEDGFTLSLIGPDDKPNLLELPANTTHTDLLISDSVSYRLLIMAYSNNGIRSSTSDIYTWNPPSEKTAPPAPGNLTARVSWAYAEGGKTVQSAIDLEFTEPFIQISRFIVERREGNGPFEVLSKESLTQTALHKIKNTGMKDGLKYTYRIKAVNSYGESPYSSEALAIVGDTSTIGAPPIAPFPGSVGSKKSITFNLGSSKMLVDGLSQAIDSGNETRPVVSASGRTLIPIRSMIENLGGTVEWISSENKVLIELNGKKVELFIGKYETLVNGQPVTSDEPAQIINGRTLLPIRFVSENLGLKVDWSPVDKSISIAQ